MASRGINKVIIVGNLGQDPEVRFMPNGNAVANFTVATSETWKDKQTGEQKEKTEWHRMVAYQRLAEVIGEYLKKGAKVYIEGKLQTRKWQDSNGDDKYTTEIIVNDMQMLDSRGQGGQGQGGGFNQGQSQGQSQPVNQGGFNQGGQQGGYQQNTGNVHKPPQQNIQQNQGGYQQNQNNQAQQQGGYQQSQSNQPQNQGNYQQNQAQSQQGGFNQQNQNFDDDIPFAPIGLPLNNAWAHCV